MTTQSDNDGGQRPSPESSNRPDQPGSLTVQPAELPAGSVLSIGVDFESISRVDKLLRRYGDHFLNRVFTEDEIAYSLRRKLPAQHPDGPFLRQRGCDEGTGYGPLTGCAVA